MTTLQEYIQEEVKKGYSREVITQALLKYKYPKDAIDKVFEKIVLDTEIKKKEHLFHLGEMVFVIGALILLTFGSLWWLSSTRIGRDDQQKAPIPSVTLPTPTKSDYFLEAINKDNMHLCLLAQNKGACIAHFALKNNNVSLCEGGDECLARVALEKRDNSLCKNAERNSECFSYMAKVSKDSNWCNQAKNPLRCNLFLLDNDAQVALIRKNAPEKLSLPEILSTAIYFNNVKMCDLLSLETTHVPLLEDTREKYSCILGVALGLRDEEICSQIENKNDKNTCVSIIKQGCSEEYHALCDYML